MRTIRCLAALALLALASPGAHALGYNGPRGLWYDRAHDGHGIDVSLVNGTLFVVLYTYEANGEPEWYTAQGRLQGATLESDLLRFRHDAPTQRAVLDATVGRLTLRYDATPGEGACADGTVRTGASELALLDFSIGGERNSWCVEPLVPAQVQPETAIGGLWWGGADDAGWGLSNYFLPEAGALHSIHLLYHYDAAGHPRWVLADARSPAFEVALAWRSFLGYCRTCPPRARESRAAGDAVLTLSSPRVDAGANNRITLAARYPGSAGGGWNRAGTLARYSDTILPRVTVATREGLVAADPVTDSGSVRYLGIPYAAPPIGEDRWRAPRPAAPRTSLLGAYDTTPSCPQDTSQAFAGAAPATLSEDCLTLNVWVARLPRAPSLPVMVWIHGGGLVQGGALIENPPGGGLLGYDGTNAIARDVVFVSINYRLGPLGFLALPELSLESPDSPSSGNAGFLDQVQALRWVRDNIAAFGGDPRNVTIYGESAGGVSVCAHLASPLSRGLFQRAIVQSGSCANTLQALDRTVGTLEPAYVQGERVAARAGCPAGPARLDCLRAKSAQELVVAGQGTVGFGREGEGYGFKLDGHAFDRAPGIALADGSAAPVPLVIGTNEDEATVLLAPSLKPATAEAYEALVRTRFPLIAEAILARYPASAYQPPWRAFAAIVTDVGFICPSIRAARTHAAQGNPTYAYYFTQTSPAAPELGAFHALEIPYLFNVITPTAPGAAGLADRMRQAWTTFARTGVPDTGAAPAWPPSPASGALGLELNGAGDRVVSGYRSEYCAFWGQYIPL